MCMFIYTHFIYLSSAVGHLGIWRASFHTEGGFFIYLIPNVFFKLSFLSSNLDQVRNVLNGYWKRLILFYESVNSIHVTKGKQTHSKKLQYLWIAKNESVYCITKLGGHYVK